MDDHVVAYDEELAERVRELVPAGSDEVRMFGGIAFMVGGNMACAVGPQGLLIRVGKAGYDDALAAGGEPMVMGGRTMRGYVRVDAPDNLARWVATGVGVARSLPPKG